jgi:hypothetical protein
MRWAFSPCGMLFDFYSAFQLSEDVKKSDARKGAALSAAEKLGFARNSECPSLSFFILNSSFLIGGY